MIAFFEFYLSSFWTWAGITFGVSIILSAIAGVIASVRK